MRSVLPERLTYYLFQTALTFTPLCILKSLPRLWDGLAESLEHAY